MVRKYHLCDLFTLLEVILTCTLIVMTVLHVSPDYAIWVFVAGELCDAIDGPCARRWPYPDDSKKRWWRLPHVVQAIEHISDILLIGSLALYLLFQPGLFHYLTLYGSLAIALICLVVQYLLFTKPYSSAKRKSLTLLRRRFYLVGIIIGIAELIFCTTWALPLKIGACILGLIAGVIILIAKWNRFTESDKTFRDFLHH